MNQYWSILPISRESHTTLSKSAIPKHNYPRAATSITRG